MEPQEKNYAEIIYLYFCGADDDEEPENPK